MFFQNAWAAFCQALGIGVAGQDLSAVFRIRLTDLNNCGPSPCGGPYATAATSTDTMPSRRACGNLP